MAVAQWITLLLTQGHYPLSSTNEVALAEWAQSEGMPASSNNPLAASDQIAGAKPTPGFPEPTYPSIQAAVTLYLDKFQSLTYKAIDFALKDGSNLNLIYEAINNSPWCSGCQGGHYPVVLYNTLTGGSEPPSPPHGSPGAGAVLTASGFSGWADLRNSVNTHLPTQLSRSQALRKAALRGLSSGRKVG